MCALYTAPVIATHSQNVNPLGSQSPMQECQGSGARGSTQHCKPLPTAFPIPPPNPPPSATEIPCPRDRVDTNLSPRPSRVPTDKVHYAPRDQGYSTSTHKSHTVSYSPINHVPHLACPGLPFMACRHQRPIAPHDDTDFAAFDALVSTICLAARCQPPTKIHHNIAHCPQTLARPANPAHSGTPLAASTGLPLA